MSRRLSWVHTRTLWVADPNGRTYELRAAGTGVYDPQWSRDGRHVLYLRDNAIWLIGVSGGPPVKIVGPLPTAPGLFGYYGHVSVTSLFAWWQPKDTSHESALSTPSRRTRPRGASGVGGRATMRVRSLVKTRRFSSKVRRSMP